MIRLCRWEVIPTQPEHVEQWKNRSRSLPLVPDLFIASSGSARESIGRMTLHLVDRTASARNEILGRASAVTLLGDRGVLELSRGRAGGGLLDSVQ